MSGGGTKKRSSLIEQCTKRLEWKLKLPDYNCANHLNQYLLKGKVPDCRVKGLKCRIGEEIASNPDVKRIVDSYYFFKRLPAVERSQALSTKLLDNGGLLDDPDLLLCLENTYIEITNQQKHVDEVKQIHKRKR